MPTSSDTPRPTETSTPTKIPTRTPRPTATPLPELTAADVGLPIRPENKTGIYLPCYLLTDTMFHAGDGWFYEYELEQYHELASPYTIYAPIAGRVTESHLVTEAIRYEITVATPFSLNGKQVYYDVVHTNGPVNGVSVGSWIEQGQALALISSLSTPNGWIWNAMADIGFRNGPKGANASLDNWQPYSYFDPLPFYEDELLLNDEITVLPRCSGNPIAPELKYKLTPEP
jgi:hypothetical protein